MNNSQDVQRALTLIRSVPLTAPEHKLFSCFVRDAVDPKAAALYVLQRASQGDTKDIEFELRHILTEWKQLVKRCLSIHSFLPLFEPR
jgi:hypothetical protein